MHTRRQKTNAPTHRKLRAIVDDIIYERLKHFKFNRTRTAESLGISIRTMRGVAHRLKNEGYEIPETVLGHPPKYVKDCKDFQE